MSSWPSLKWLLWIGLYAIPILFLPWITARAWVRRHKTEVAVGSRQMFQRGELGLMGLVLACSVIWSLLQSQFAPITIAAASILVALCGIMSLDVWVEGYCRQSTGSSWTPSRAWRDSRNMALLVFTIAAVLEIMLDRFAKVVAR